MLYFVLLIEALMPFFSLVFSYIVLSCYMRKYHTFEYKQIHCSLLTFVLIESIDFFSPFVRAIVGQDAPWYNLIMTIYIFGGGYVMIQSLGIIFVKKTRDPLERISKIGYLQLISSNQRVNEQFMTNMFQNTEWKNLR